MRSLLGISFFVCSMVGGLSAGCGPSSIGIGIGAVGTTPPPPRPGMVVQEWEHYCVVMGSLAQFEEALDKAGKAGWEMVGFGGNNAVCFKRPVIASAPKVPATP